MPGDLAALGQGQPFLSQETRYGDAKFDEGNIPQKVAASAQRWRSFDRWLREAQRSFTGVLTEVRGDMLRLRSPASGHVTVFSFDASRVDSPAPIDSLTGKKVRVEYRRGGYRPEVARIRLAEPVLAVPVLPGKIRPIPAPDRHLQGVEPARPPVPRPPPGGVDPAPAKRAPERWRCDVDLHQGDTGTLWLDRQRGEVQGIMVVRDGTQKHRVSGSWTEDRIELWRALSESSGQPFVGTVTGPGDGTLRMAGRFAHQYSGVWSAECRRGDDEPGKPATPATERVNVVLVEAGSRRIEVIKTVRAITGMGLKDTAEAVDGVPFVVASGIPVAEAKEIAAELTAAGGKVEIRPAP